MTKLECGGLEMIVKTNGDTLRLGKGLHHFISYSLHTYSMYTHMNLIILVVDWKMLAFYSPYSTLEIPVQSLIHIEDMGIRLH